MINGIKPKITTPTKLGIKITSFDEAMGKFCDRLALNCDNYVAGFKFMHSVRFEACGGRKYIKVKSFETRVETDYETGVETLVEGKKGSIHCFVEKTTGDIYKPAGWKAPYTKGNNCVRGNIYDVSTFEKTDLHGGWLYAK
tara:strand:+ start:155 stop:577 length:423 start_codon:yes stop_codon:yes gene_type:complete